MKKQFCMLTLLVSTSVNAMEVVSEEGLTLDSALSGIATNDTLLVFAENEEILSGDSVSPDRAREAVRKNLQKDTEYLSKEEQLEAKETHFFLLKKEIEKAYTLLESELSQSEVDEEATSKKVDELENLWKSLQESCAENGITVSIQKTVVEKKAEHARQQTYITQLKLRVVEVKNGLVALAVVRNTNLQILEKTRLVRAGLEEDTLKIAETHEGAAGNTTTELLRERIEARKQAAEGSQEEIPQQKGTLSKIWDKCIIA